MRPAQINIETERREKNHSCDINRIQNFIWIFKNQKESVKSFTTMKCRCGTFGSRSPWNFSHHFVSVESCPTLCLVLSYSLSMFGFSSVFSFPWVIRMRCKHLTACDLCYIQNTVSRFRGYLNCDADSRKPVRHEKQSQARTNHPQYEKLN